MEMPGCLATFFPSPCNHSPMTASSGGPGPLATVLLAHEKARSRAWREKNSRALEVLLAPDYLEINGLGRFTKKEIIGHLLPLSSRSECLVSDPHLIVSSPDSAILTYRSTGDLASGGKQTAGASYVAAHYAKREGRWVLLLWQVTPAPSKGDSNGEWGNVPTEK